MTYLKYYFIILVMSMACTSCHKEADCNLIFGKWQDIHDYPISFFDANGDSVFMKFPNIIYHLDRKGTFSIENEVPLGIPCNGNFTIFDKTVFFIEDCPKNSLVPFIGIDGIARYKNKSDDFPILNFSWDLLTLNEKEMEVKFIYSSIALAPSEKNFTTSYKRKFIRVK